jgi:hypothetical protein
VQLTHRAYRVFLLFRAVVANQEKADHNTSYTRLNRHVAGDLRGGCENNDLACVCYIIVKSRDDHAGDGEETNIC